MKNKTRLLLSILLGLSSLQPAASSVPDSLQDVAGRSYMLPSATEGVKSPVIDLNGEWKFKFDRKSSWKPVRVPGEAAMQGYAIRHDVPFFYEKTFTLPKDFSGKRVILRFDGVYTHARLTVNGKFVREHHGGFSRWETDITPYVRAGRQVKIGLEVTDRIDDISYAAGYAHHPIGGILRDVTVFALPATHLYDVSFETRLDSTYTHAELRFTAALDDASPEADALRLRLTDSNGKVVEGGEKTYRIKEGRNQVDMHVANPRLWDAEHPNLYRLEATLTDGGKEVYAFTRHVGFRDIRVVKDKVLVNGRQVKLRGACRHDIHPRMGRSTNRGLDSLDAVLFKEANMNFVRTSHYPPSEDFLDFCDRYGIYVESETAVCFVNTYRQKNFAPGASMDDPAFARRYLGQLQEMVKSHRSHASVLLWSIGNESAYGRNFQLSYDWVKEHDTTRPVIFSYPGSAREKKAGVFDVLSMHYQDAYGNVDQWGMQTRGFQGEGLPALFDEWAHPACYTYTTLQNDPNIREFWGKSLDMMWSGLYNAPGGLGGAVWCFSDETFDLPEPKTGTTYWKEFHHTAKPEGFRGNCVGYGEWGIVDKWRRRKPEFWATKKAYSPVRLIMPREMDCTPGQPVVITVMNRFDHTGLNEIRATYIYKGNTRKAALSDAQPHEKGTLTLGAENWEKGERVRIEFARTDGSLIDAEEFVVGKETTDLPKTMEAGKLRVTENAERFVVSGKGFEVPVNKLTGLIENATVNGETVIEKGPFLNLYINLNHLSGAEVRKMARFFAVDEKDWKLTSLRTERGEDAVNVFVEGAYHSLRETRMCYCLRITAGGEISVVYQVENAPNGYLRETGLAFHLPDEIRTLEWKRRGYWSCYPEGEFAGNGGKTALRTSEQAAYGEEPVQPWQADNREFYYFADRGANCERPLTRMAKGMKENIYRYSLHTAARHGFSVVAPDADVACRINTLPDSKAVLYANNRWDYPEIAWGNFCKKLEALPIYGTIKLQLQ